MKSVSDVLKQKKLPKDYPPTKSDVKLREKHVPESVKYNVQKHMHDHAENAIDQIKKVAMVNPSKAKQLVQECIKEVDSIRKKFEECL